MKRITLYFALIPAIACLFVLGAQILSAEAPDANHIAVPLADPSRPAQVHAHLLNGSITVKAYDGKEIIVDAKAREHDHDEDEEDRPREHREGNMHRIPVNTTGLSIEAEGQQRADRHGVDTPDCRSGHHSAGPYIRLIAHGE